MTSPISSSSQTQDISQLFAANKPKSPEEMFSDLSTKVGGDSDGITKDELQTYLQQLQDNGQGDSKDAKFISNLVSNFDTVADSDSGKITSDSLQKGMESLRPHKGNKGQKDPFSDLSTKVGGDSDGITKDELQSYLQKLQDNGDGDSKDAKFISNLISNFDTVSDSSSGKITSDSLQKGMDSLKSSSANGRYDFQDPSTVTKDQLQSPIDISV